MKKTFPALAILAVLLGFGLWNARAVETDIGSWQADLHQADTLIRAQCWAEAQNTLDACYQAWIDRQPYLRVVSTHSILDEAECLYRRVIAFTSIQEQEELLADLSALQQQLELLSLREQLSLQNIL